MAYVLLTPHRTQIFPASDITPSNNRELTRPISFPDNLTEQIAAETAERQSRMRAEISKATKENKEFVRNVQKSKELGGIQSKAASKKTRETEGTGTGTAPSAAAIVEEAEPKPLRKFKQASAGKKAQEKTSAAAKRVLSQLF